MIKKITLLCAGLLAAGQAFAADQGQLLREKLKQFDQFHAQFSQQVFDKKGTLLQESYGQMDVQQPNKFRWQTREPDESLIISDGNSVWLYNPGLDSVTAMSLDSTIEQSPLWLIANQQSSAWENFKVTGGKEHFVITPKDPQSLTHKIEIFFGDGEISKLMIEDRQGQYSHFHLSEFQPLQNKAADLFKFEVPEGVDFDDQR